MICPRCTTAALEEQFKDSVVIDVCSSCRGVWLDRGELEALNQRAIEAAHTSAARVGDDDDEDTIPYQARATMSSRLARAINTGRW